jgi:type II secretory pathway pseudopilin PulG
MPILAQRAARTSATSSAGFTYVWLLLAVAFMAAGLAAIAEVAMTAMRRDKEAELLFVGDQFARAIALYRASSPGAQQYPQRLEDLLADKRVPNVRRHLRRVYRDPMTGSADWGLVRGPGGGIVGVYSRSTTKPLKTANFPKGYEAFGNTASYAEWRFVAGVDGKIAAAVPGTTPQGGATSAPPSVTSLQGGAALAPPSVTLPQGGAALAPPSVTLPQGGATLASPSVTLPQGGATLAPPSVTLQPAAPRPTVPVPERSGSSTTR